MKWDEIHSGFLLKAMNSVLKKLTSGKISNFKVQVVIEKCFSAKFITRGFITS